MQTRQKKQELRYVWHRFSILVQPSSIYVILRMHLLPVKMIFHTVHIFQIRISKHCSVFCDYRNPDIRIQCRCMNLL